MAGMNTRLWRAREAYIRAKTPGAKILYCHFSPGEVSEYVIIDTDSLDFVNIYKIRVDDEKASLTWEDGEFLLPWALRMEDLNGTNIRDYGRIQRRMGA